MMRPDEMREMALDLFKQRMHCSQVLAKVGLKKLGIDEPSVIKALGSFGGGIGGTGHICGALVGATSVIGTLYSRASLEEKENPRMWAATKKVMAQFTELTAPFGGINCGQIARVDWMDRDQVKDFYDNPDSRRQCCMTVVGETAKALGELLEQEAERAAAKQAEQQGK
ncbi:MAG: C-GCAxxG-C-C family protein [Desulfobulbus sp.]|nr:C-GCAxxG-C-C family protein [Desulfobulbus sp.]